MVVNTCIFCNATDNLNTQMTITNEDGNKVAVKICDSHAEDATVKLAREAYNKRLEQIKQLMEQAQALGINLGKINIEQTGSGITIVDKAPEPSRQVQQESKQVDQGLLLNPDDPTVIHTSKLNAREFRSVAGQVSGTSLESHQAYGLNRGEDKIDPSALDGYAQMAISEGRTGQQIAIPAIRQDKTGTTTITIRKSESDASLQARTKRLAQASLNDESMSYKDGYAGYRQCPLCRGVGFINTGKARPVCPKCNGLGNIVNV